MLSQSFLISLQMRLHFEFFLPFYFHFKFTNKMDPFSICFLFQYNECFVISARSSIPSSTFPCYVMRWCKYWGTCTRKFTVVKTYTWSLLAKWLAKSVSQDMQVYVSIILLHMINWRPQNGTGASKVLEFWCINCTLPIQKWYNKNIA